MHSPSTKPPLPRHRNRPSVGSIDALSVRETPTTAVPISFYRYFKKYPACRRRAVAKE